MDGSTSAVAVTAARSGSQCSGSRAVNHSDLAGPGTGGDVGAPVSAHLADEPRPDLTHDGSPVEGIIPELRKRVLGRRRLRPSSASSARAPSSAHHVAAEPMLDDLADCRRPACALQLARPMRTACRPRAGTPPPARRRRWHGRRSRRSRRAGAPGRRTDTAAARTGSRRARGAARQRRTKATKSANEAISSARHAQRAASQDGSPTSEPYTSADRSRRASRRPAGLRAAEPGFGGAPAARRACAGATSRPASPAARSRSRSPNQWPQAAPRDDVPQVGERWRRPARCR